MSKVTRKRKTTGYSNGISAYLGKLNVGSVDWDSCTTNKELYYKVTCTLPMIKQKTTNYLTEELGKEALVHMVNFWIDEAGLKQ